MLAEMYTILKEEFPTHGLEIVFVSGDRNPSEFEQYFSSMPWLAVAGYQNQLLSARYQVRGIPSLVILDAVSGEIVIPNAIARREVQEACQRGEESICNMFRSWLDRVPIDTKELLHMLEASCDTSVDDKDDCLIPKAYLTSKEHQHLNETRESLVSQLMGEGMDKDEALEAANAVIEVSIQDETNHSIPLGPGSFHDAFNMTIQRVDERDFGKSRALAQAIQSNHDPIMVVNLLETARKYLINCRNAPHSIRFRRIDLSFKLIDSKIARFGGGLQLLESVGFSIDICGDSYMLYIAVHVDVNLVEGKMKELIEEFKD